MKDMESFYRTRNPFFGVVKPLNENRHEVDQPVETPKNRFVGDSGFSGEFEVPESDDNFERISDEQDGLLDVR